MLYGIHKTYGEEKVRGGDVVMIGPLPIAFGSDVASLKVVMILAIVLMIFARAVNLLGVDDYILQSKTVLFEDGRRSPRKVATTPDNFRISNFLRFLRYDSKIRDSGLC
jgi:hypothetical protein